MTLTRAHLTKTHDVVPSQCGDTLIVGSDHYAIHSGPGLPVRHLGIRNALICELSELDDVCSTDACERGYIATWLVRENRLLLVDLIGRLRLTCGGPLVANWYSGTLRAILKSPAERQTFRENPSGLTSDDSKEHVEYRFEFKSGSLCKTTQSPTGLYTELSLSA